MFRYLKKQGIRNFVGVPDSTLKFFIDEGLNGGDIVISTREEEAIGIASGMSLSGSRPAVFMQNAGFANSISTITSLVQMYGIPLLFIIGWRGYLPDDAPEHKKIGKIQPELLRIIGLESRIITEKDWQKKCDWALGKIRSNRPCALIVRRMFHD